MARSRWGVIDPKGGSRRTAERPASDRRCVCVHRSCRSRPEPVSRMGSSQQTISWTPPGLQVNWARLCPAVGAAVFFSDGLEALLEAWSLPEYSHGPLIPILSALLFLRQLKMHPPDPGPKRNRWVGLTIVIVSLMLATLG